MQAAEAYTARSRANSRGRAQEAAASGRGTWSARSNTSERPRISGECFQPPTKTRTASASPGPNRRRRSRSGDQRSEADRVLLLPPKVPLPPPTSTHSTPSRKPAAKKSARELANELDAEDDLILQRMEKILLNYKSKVGTEGKRILYYDPKREKYQLRKTAYTADLNN